MKFYRLAILILVGAVSIGASGCAKDNNANTTTQTANEQTMDDGSKVSVTNAPDGTKTEVRTFETGEVARVTRTTRPEGKRTAKVEFRDGRETELEDENDIEQAIEASRDWVVSTASKAWDKSKQIGSEVGDKAEDVAGKAVDTGKKVGSETKKGAGEVADKAEDVGDAMAKGAKKVGKGAKKVGEKIKP